MRKTLMIFALCIMSVLSASAADGYSRNIADLPVAARTMLKNNFKSKMSLIKIDKGWGRVSEYEVILNDGTEVKFDNSGNWKEVEVSESGSVPAKVIPAAILKYVKTNHKGLRVIGIEKKRSGYEVELSNGLDMEFDARGNFLRYD